MSQQKQEYYRIVSGIYAGLSNPVCWHQAMQLANAHLGCTFSMTALAEMRPSALRHTSFHGSSVALRSNAFAHYSAVQYRSDPTLRFMQRRRRGVMDSRRHVDLTESNAADFCRWLQEALAADHWIAIFSPMGEQQKLLFCAYFSASRPVQHGKTRALIHDLFGHLCEAQRLASEPPNLPRPNEATLLLDRQARVIARTPAVDRLLRTVGGISLQDERLLFSDSAMQEKFQSQILKAWSSESGYETVLAITSTSGVNTECLLRLRRSQTIQGPFGPAAAWITVKITGPEQRAAPFSSERWKQDFGFTAAECGVADSLVTGGGTLRNVAERLGISYATARVHLARCFHKAGVHSQAQLAALLLTHNPPNADDADAFGTTNSENA